ncbi:hypothetical protein NE236_02275 [Actinoallomurus purpureus]|nr:hypothetical protein [Actinoallomurus purpureus]
MSEAPATWLWARRIRLTAMTTWPGEVCPWAARRTSTMMTPTKAAAYPVQPSASHAAPRIAPRTPRRSASSVREACRAARASVTPYVRSSLAVPAVVARVNRSPISRRTGVSSSPVRAWTRAARRSASAGISPNSGISMTGGYTVASRTMIALPLITTCQARRSCRGAEASARRSSRSWSISDSRSWRSKCSSRGAVLSKSAMRSETKRLRRSVSVQLPVTDSVPSVAARLNSSVTMTTPTVISSERWASVPSTM